MFKLLGAFIICIIIIMVFFIAGLLIRGTIECIKLEKRNREKNKCYTYDENCGNFCFCDEINPEADDCYNIDE